MSTMMMASIIIDNINTIIIIIMKSNTNQAQYVNVKRKWGEAALRDESLLFRIFRARDWHV